jgi:hypothetical protein
MSNPYHRRSNYSFWKQAVTDQADRGVDPVVCAPFKIGLSDAVATAGSCFAQHISRTLVRQGFNYLVTEKFNSEHGTIDENYGVFPARFANIYTSRQLVQLFDRAYGLFRPEVDWWVGKGGGYIDPFRPRIQANGFESAEALIADRKRHLASVRTKFETCQVLIFTLGLTEAWLWNADGAAFPLAPGVVAPDISEDKYHFHNLSVSEVVADLNDFLEKLKEVNPGVRVMLTVSPVSLIATFEDRHVLVSTIASKSILRAAVDEICRCHPNVAYFPSYEIITGPQTGARFYEPDLREVTDVGVSYVMSIFSKHYLENPMPSAGGGDSASSRDASQGVLSEARKRASLQANPSTEALDREDRSRLKAVNEIVCDEEEIVSDKY